MPVDRFCEMGTNQQQHLDTHTLCEGEYIGHRLQGVELNNKKFNTKYKYICIVYVDCTHYV